MEQKFYKVDPNTHKAYEISEEEYERRMQFPFEDDKELKDSGSKRDKSGLVAA